MMAFTQFSLLSGLSDDSYSLKKIRKREIHLTWVRESFLHFIGANIVFDLGLD